jgi:hypothetical protein
MGSQPHAFWMIIGFNLMAAELRCVVQDGLPGYLAGAYQADVV